MHFQVNHFPIEALGVPARLQYENRHVCLRLGVLLLAGLMLAGAARADIIPTGRRTDWSRAGVIGGIPNVTTINTTIAAGASAATINAAIAACPSNQVVKLGPGTFTISSQIRWQKRNGVVLRGSGGPNSWGNVNATVLNYTGAGFGAFQFEGDNANHDFNASGAISSMLARWTANYSQGTTVLTFDNTNNLKLGYTIVLDQDNYDNEVTLSGQQGCNYCSRTNGTRAFAQYVQVTAISGTSPNFSVTIDPPITSTNFASIHHPESYWWGDSIRRAGIEDLAIDYTSSGATWGITPLAAYECWVLNVDSHKSDKAVVHTYVGASHCEVRRCYFHDSLHDTSESYGVNWYYSGDNLAIDNAFSGVVGAIVNEISGGNVFAYNYMTNVVYYNPDWNIIGFSTHGAQCYMSLFEGNWGNGMAGDDIHGSGSDITVFRNRLIGTQPGRTLNTYAILLQEFNHNFNIVGNILGTAGYHTQYEQARVNANAQAVIYDIGYLSNGTHTWPGNYDDEVYTTLLRHGNYDTVNNAIVWDGTISDHAIPDSLYLTSKPSWWGATQPWPPFDPSRTTAKDTDPTNLPAGFRFIFQADPPAGGGGGGTAPSPTFKLKGGRGGLRR